MEGVCVSLKVSLRPGYRFPTPDSELSSMPQFVITAVGPDRPGLVHELTGLLLAGGANVADSRMINLRGQFALILLAEAPHDQASSLSASLREEAEQLDMTISVIPAPATRDCGGAGSAPTSSAPSVQTETHCGVPYRLQTYAMDQPGIVHRIAHLLHAHGVNIEELQTRLEPRSYTDTPVFTMDLRMTVPTNLQIRELRDELQALCDSLNCKADLNPG